MVAHTNRTAKLDLRLTPESKSTIQAAAAAAHRSVSEYVLESALVQAELTLSARRHFTLNADQWEALQTALDAPARVIPAVRELFSKPSVFEQ